MLSADFATDIQLTDLSGAIFSEDRQYRHLLWRLTGKPGQILLVILLNQSIADANKNDPTVARQIKRASLLGCTGGLIVANSHDLVSTDPRGLKKHPQPNSPDNDKYIMAAARFVGRDGKCIAVTLPYTDPSGLPLSSRRPRRALPRPSRLGPWDRGMKEKIFTVYSLIDPFTEEVRYVGCTSGSMPDRMKIHIHDARRSNGYKGKTDWIISLLERQERPQYKVLERIPESEWEESERKWIAFYRSCGAKLLNRTIGGLGQHGCIANDETRLKHAEASRNRIWREESKEKIRQSKLGKKRGPFSKEYCDHMSEVHPTRLKTHCPQGHEYTPENIYWVCNDKNRRPHRHCRACRKIRSTEASRKRRAAIKAAKLLAATV